MRLKYLEWAREAKQSWKDDGLRWNCHVNSHFKGKMMASITGFDVQRVIDDLSFFTDEPAAKAEGDC